MSFAAQAKNPGESAQHCVRARADGKGKVTFSNRCSEQIFVMWCGDLTYSKQRCGDAGGVGFGKKGFWTDEPNGSYRCLPGGR